MIKPLLPCKGRRGYQLLTHHQAPAAVLGAGGVNTARPSPCCRVRGSRGSINCQSTNKPTPSHRTPAHAIACHRTPSHAIARHRTALHITRPGPAAVLGARGVTSYVQAPPAVLGAGGGNISRPSPCCRVRGRRGDNHPNPCCICRRGRGLGTASSTQRTRSTTTTTTSAAPLPAEPRLTPCTKRTIVSRTCSTKSCNTTRPQQNVNRAKCSVRSCCPAAAAASTPQVDHERHCQPSSSAS